MVILAILTPNLRHLLRIEIFFIIKFNLLLHFLGVKFTGNYYTVAVIT